jgi:heme exporter protein CcmD
MEALAMGDYGAFVWSSFGVMFIVVILSAVQARHRHQRTLRDITQRIKSMDNP